MLRSGNVLLCVCGSYGGWGWGVKLPGKTPKIQAEKCMVKGDGCRGGGGLKYYLEAAFSILGYTIGTSPMVKRMKSTHGSATFKQCGQAIIIQILCAKIVQFRYS